MTDIKSSKNSEFDPASERWVSLATFRRDGTEVRTPVCIAKAGDRFYVFSEGNVGKIKRIRNNGQARIAACTLRGDIKSEWIDCTAAVTSDAETIAAVYRALHAKYGWMMKITDFFSKLAGKYEKRAIIEIEIVSP